MELPAPSLAGVPALTLIPEECSSDSSPEWHSTAISVLIDGLRSLQNDHTSGAKELATKSMEVLVKVSGIVGDALLRLDEGHDSLSERWWTMVRRAAWYISTYGRPSMGAAITAALVHALNRKDLGLPPLDSNGAPENKEGAATNKELLKNGMRNIRLSLHRRKYNDAPEGVGVQLRMFLRKRFNLRHWPQDRRELKILTLSSSSTIREAILALLELEHADDLEEAKLVLDFKVMESRPLCEGVALAKALVERAELGGYTDLLRIEIASDASVALLARDVDVVLLGADRISDSGDVSNKMGSFPAVLCAKTVSQHAVVLAVSELEKVAKPGAMEEHAEEDNDVDELVSTWRGDVEMPEAWGQVVRVRNVYFEWVPSRYIDYYICEKGTLDAERIRQCSYHVLELERQAFSGLSMPSG